MTYILTRIRAWIDAHIPADPEPFYSDWDVRDGLTTKVDAFRQNLLDDGYDAPYVDFHAARYEEWLRATNGAPRG